MDRENLPITITPVSTLKDNYVWTLINTDQQTALIIDPGEAKPVADFLSQQQAQLSAIFITHHHGDHTQGIAGLVIPKIPVYAPALETVPHQTIALKNNDTVKLAHFPSFQIIDIPGHTLGHIAYYSPGMLFCGDTLFAAGCGRLFEGTAEQLFASLQKIAALPEDTFIYCGHEYTLNNLRFAATVEPQNVKIKERYERVQALREKQLPSLPSSLREEKETNPFLRCHSHEVITQVEKYAQRPLNNAVDVFTWLRKWKDGF